jgi:hypothetical protein
VGILDPYSVLRLLAEAKANEDAPVVWQYGPLVQAGWTTEREFVPHARPSETFLIATEGSSDVHILKHALALLRPGIADFFRFIDVSESHPFSNTANLVKFAEGLAFRRNVLLMLSGYRATFPHAEDYDLFLRIADCGTVENPNEMLIYYRDHPQSVSRRNIELQEMAMAYAEFAAIEIHRGCVIDPSLTKNSSGRLTAGRYGAGSSPVLKC